MSDPSPAAVLVIEDDDSQRRTLEDLLRDEGYRPVCCASVERALELLEQSDFAAAVVDQRLPGGSGIDFLQQIHGRPGAPKVIINTGHGSFESAKRSVNLGAFAYVEKAGDPDELIREVHRAVRLHVEDALRATQARLSALVEHAPLAVDLKDAEGRYLLVNRRHQTFHRQPPGGIQGLRASDIHEASLAQRIVALDAEVLRKRHVVEREYEIGPEPRATVLVTKFPVLDGNGRVLGVGSVGMDITERRRAERALARSEERYQGLFDQAPDMYFTLGRDGLVRAVNEFGARYLGYEKADLIGEPISQVIHSDDREAVSRQLARLFDRAEEASELEYRKRRRDGEILWVHARVRLLDETPGEDPELQMVCRDVTEARTLSEELSYQASHDALTGLVNRRELEKRLGRVLETARADDSEHALCYLDLDQFKVINDTCGHVAGDELLRQLGELLPRRVRRRDTLARLGGDEFAVLMEHCTLMQARRVANSLREAVGEYRFMWQGKTFSLGVSIGLVPISRSSEGVSGILRAADTACYVAKDQGRNRIHVYHEGDLELARRHGEMEWVARVDEALRNDGFELWYQPIAPLQPRGLAEGEASRYEVLLRLLGERSEPILPGAFLPAAERYNAAVRVDRWVVSRALEWLARHRDALPGPTSFSLNLSGHSMADEGFLSFVTETFRDTNVPANMICFEITETAAISNLASANRFISTLHDAGCRFALDDFGSGLSSFAYLKHLPVDFLKIDGVFVKDILDDPIDLAMVRAIYDVAQAMRKRTIAEFVDDERVLAKLREIGVEYAQGYAVGRPAPISQLLPETAGG